MEEPTTHRSQLSAKAMPSHKQHLLIRNIPSQPCQQPDPTLRLAHQRVILNLELQACLATRAMTYSLNWHALRKFIQYVLYIKQWIGEYAESTSYPDQ